jgi:YhcH/YjgK/YiaL family protein
MIFDTFDKLAAYGGAIPHISAVLSYLEKTDLSALDLGRYPIQGDDAYLMIQEYDTKPEAEKRFEAHRVYVDIQIVLRGEECMGYAPLGTLPETQAYDGAKDAAFFCGEALLTLRVPAGFFCVFFPQDAHKPGFFAERSEAVRKAVIKVRAS